MAEKKSSKKTKPENTEEINETSGGKTCEAEINEKDPKDQEIEQLKNQLLTVMAEFDNYKKRTVKEKEKI